MNGLNSKLQKTDDLESLEQNTCNFRFKKKRQKFRKFKRNEIG